MIGELDARRQQRNTLQHSGFTYEAEALGSHGYVYIAIPPAADPGATHDTKKRHQLRE